MGLALSDTFFTVDEVAAESSGKIFNRGLVPVGAGRSDKVRVELKHHGKIWNWWNIAFYNGARGHEAPPLGKNNAIRMSALPPKDAMRQKDAAS